MGDMSYGAGPDGCVVAPRSMGRCEDNRTSYTALMFEILLQDWDGEEVAIAFDDVTGTWMFVCVHSTKLGPAMGGVRMKSYGSADDALADGLRLAGAMTRKQAVANLPFGGGKAVLAVSTIPVGEDRRRLLLRYGDLVASLRGTYVTAADMNTDEADMDVVAERSSHVLGRSRAAGGSGDPASATASGVFYGMLASAGHVWGTTDLRGRRVLVQGAGAVGSRLVDHVAATGATLIVADSHEGRAEEIAARAGAEVLSADAVVGSDCDIFAPCAVGGILTAATIPRLRCALVAGAANNQLGEPEDAQRLRDAGILYAPDYVINAGGVIHLAGYESLGWTEGEVTARLAAIGDVLGEIYLIAEADGITTEAAASRLVTQRLSPIP